MFLEIWQVRQSMDLAEETTEDDCLIKLTERSKLAKIDKCRMLMWLFKKIPTEFGKSLLLCQLFLVTKFIYPQHKRPPKGLQRTIFQMPSLQPFTITETTARSQRNCFAKIFK